MEQTHSLDIDSIRDLATRFRSALDLIDRASLSIGLQQFPLGACGDTCLLLGTALIERGLGEFRYVCGHTHEHGAFDSHAWLSSGNLIVDITADQFGDGMPPVFVGRDGHWYSRWHNISDLGPADYRRWDVSYANEMDRNYRLIMNDV